MKKSTFEQIIYSTINSTAKKTLVLFATALLFFVSIFLIYNENVLAKMLPGKNNDNFTIYVNTPSGTSISATRDVTRCVARTIINEPEIININSFIGQGAPMDFAGLIKGSGFKNAENEAEVLVNLVKKEKRELASYTLVQKLRPTVIEKCKNIIPNTDFSFVEPPAGPPVLAAIVSEITSTNNIETKKIAKEIENILKNTSGLVDVDTLSDEPYKKFKMNINQDKLYRSGLTIEQVNQILYLSFQGKEITAKNSVDAKRQIPVFLKYDEAASFKSKSLSDAQDFIRQIKLMNKKGQQVPLASFVDITEEWASESIYNKNLRPITRVVAETDMVSQVYPLLDARTQIIDTFSNEYNIEKTGLFDLTLVNKNNPQLITELKWDGEMRVTIDTFIELGGAFIAALVLIFLLMVVYYKSFALSGIVLLGSFLSIIGVILGHLVIDIATDETFFLTATSLIGFIALIGISSRNSLLLIDFAKQLHYEDKMSKLEAIAHSTNVRAKPIFLTAVAIILASTLLAGDAVFGGLGVALIFGTLASTIASLIVVPVLLSNTKI